MQRKINIKLVLIMVLVLCFSLCRAQVLFHQDVFYGGVTSAGFSHGEGSGASGNIQLTIEPGSTVRNAWIFIYQLGNPSPSFLTINNENLFHNDFHLLNEVYHFDMGSVRLYYKDFTEHLDVSGSYNVQIHEFTAGPELNWQWCSPIIYIEYENPNLDKVSTSLWYNDKDFRGFEEYEFFGMNPINTNNDVGLSLMLDRACFNPVDRTFVELNGSSLTTPAAGIGGNNSNSSSSCAGVRGHFYYQDATLEGFDNAVANTTMDDNDALADIAPYLNDNDTGYELELEHYQWPPPVVAVAPNIITLFPHAYTTPCETFSTSVVFSDTTICRGDSIMLGASGGTSYEWLDSTVTAVNSPSPIVSPDSSQTYIVKIENEPGCYRTEQVLVNVNQLPTISELAVTPTICGEETGEINASISGASPFTLDIGEGTQSQTQFTELTTGDYTLTITDNNGCSIDTLVNVSDSIAVQSDLNVSPPSGAAPLSVALNNTSENATDYEWFIDTVFWDDAFNSSAFFDSSGVYLITLVAYNKEDHCSDTASFNINVKDSLIIKFPNVFTPNNDGVNDTYSIQIAGAIKIEGGIFNRWSNKVKSISEELTPLQQTLPIWNGNIKGEKATGGVYFYRFTIIDTEGDEEEFHGYFHLSR